MAFPIISQVSYSAHFHHAYYYWENTLLENNFETWNLGNPLLHASHVFTRLIPAPFPLSVYSMPARVWSIHVSCESWATGSRVRGAEPAAASNTLASPRFPWRRA